MATATSRVDELVKDYLLFRGLTTTLKALEVELKTDKEKGLRSDKIVEQLQLYINNSDLLGLREYWSFLNHRLFLRLEQRYASSVRRLEVNILKLYIVTASQANRQDKVLDFFDKMIQLSDLHNQPEFKEWFAFPFLKNPEENTLFAMYFNKQWQDTLLLSLHNFLSVIMQSMPVPTLLNFEYDHKRMKFLQEENNILKEKLRNMNESGNLIDGYKIDQDPNTPNEALTLDFSGLTDESSNQQEKQKTGRRLFSTGLLSKKKTETPTAKSDAKLVKSKLKSAPQTAPVTITKRPLTATPRTQSTGSLLQESTNSTPKQKSLSHAEYEKQRKELLGIEKKTTAIEPKILESENNSATSTPRKSTTIPPYVTSETKTDYPVFSSGSNDRGKSLPIEVVRQASPGIPDGDCPFLLLSQVYNKGGLYFDLLPVLYEQLQSLDEYAEHHSSISYSRFSPSGQYVASLDVDGVVKIWTWSPQPATVSTVMARSAFLSLEWVSKTDRYLLLGNRTGSVRLFDVKDNRTIKEVVVDTIYPRVINITSNPSGVSFVCSVAAQRSRSFSGNSEVTCPMSKPGKLILWDVKTMKMEKQLVIEPKPVAVNCSSYNHNGQLLVTGAADGYIRLFDIQQGKCISQWEGHDGEVNSVQFSSDETTCFSIGSDGKFIRWSINKTGNKLEELPIHQGASLPFLATSPTGNKELPRGRLFSFDSDGQYVLTCDKNKGIIYQICAESSIKKTMELKGHKSSVTTVDWSPSVDTRVVLCGAMDGKLKVSTLLPQ